MVCVFFQGDLFSGAVFLQTVLKWNLIPAVLLLLSITCIYTLAGTDWISGRGFLTQRSVRGLATEMSYKISLLV